MSVGTVGAVWIWQPTSVSAAAPPPEPVDDDVWMLMPMVPQDEVVVVW